MMDIPNLEMTKQNLDYLNSDLEKDLLRLDEANQVLLRQIQEKEETIQSLERDITLSIGQAKEREELNQIIFEKEDTLRNLELESAKLEKTNKILSNNVMELQNKISRFKNVEFDNSAQNQILEELKVRLQKSSESCAEQEKEMIKLESDYQSVYQLCKDQAHYIKKYQEILRKMEKEEEMLLLEKEISKAQKNSSQIVKPGSILVETIQSNMEKAIKKKHKRIFWYRSSYCPSLLRKNLRF
uniref:transmembrane and coiled-coil domain-containing protein 5B-like isoform X3 n=1 Tax=Ictidomys tridecemlineatus TaxID=43179 RepID=UPI001AA007C6|nr:transmembrane and coiled-coil domain-containing protein 5B-like isoform X3 [Ictidomys tridecemlineatus]